MALELFAGIPVGDLERASAWYERLLGRSRASAERHRGRVGARRAPVGLHRAAARARRPRDAHAHRRRPRRRVPGSPTAASSPRAGDVRNGVQKVTYRDPDGNEIHRRCATMCGWRLDWLPRVGAEGYQLDVTAQGVVIRAHRGRAVRRRADAAPAAAARVEAKPAARAVDGPGGQIVDYPRFDYRGAMLDVARHFFSSTRSSGTSTRSRCTRSTAAPAPGRRPGLAHRDQELAAADHVRRQHARSAAAPAATTPRTQYSDLVRLRRRAGTSR